jgi:transposase
MTLPPDARYLKIETQEYLRQQAIRLRKQGKTFLDIAEFLGVHRNTVSHWWHLYKRDGDLALNQEQRGREAGAGRHLSEAQEIELQDLILENFPHELEIDSALWTRRAVQQLIEDYSGIKMPIRTVGLYLQRWGFTPQKPLKRAYEQDPAAVQQWLDVDYPALVERAREEGADIAWGDESGLRSDAQTGRGYAPIGLTPEIDLSQKKRHRINFIASLTNQGLIRFMLYAGKLDSWVFITFLERLIEGRDRKLIWIVDRHPVHRAQVVQDWLSQHVEQIEFVFLPSYSPHLNPVEYLNGDVKEGVHSKVPSRSFEQLKERVLSHLHMLQKLPARVRSYFQHQDIAYAA